MTALLTVEGLLFAGLAAAVGVATFADNKLREAAQLARASAIALTVVAVGCEASWASIFISHWPQSLLRMAGAVGLAIGGALPPAGAWATYKLAF